MQNIYVNSSHCSLSRSSIPTAAGYSVYYQPWCLESPPLTLQTWQHCSEGSLVPHIMYLNSITSMLTTDKLCGICGGYVHLCLQTAMPPAQIQISTATVILAFLDTGMWKYCLLFLKLLAASFTSLPVTLNFSSTYCRKFI